MMAAFVGGRGSGGMQHAQATRLECYQRQAGSTWPAVDVSPLSSSLFLSPPSMLRPRTSLSFSSLAYEGGRGGGAAEGGGEGGGPQRNDAPIIRTRKFLTPLQATTSSSSSSTSSPSSSSSPSASAMTTKPKRTKQQQQQQQSLSSTSYLEEGEGEGEGGVYGLRDSFAHSPAKAVGGGEVTGMEGRCALGRVRDGCEGGREGGREVRCSFCLSCVFLVVLFLGSSPLLPPSLPPSGYPSSPYELLPEERVEGVTVFRDIKMG